MIKNLATFCFGWLADRQAKHFKFLKNALIKADVGISFRTYLSILFFTSFFAFFLSLPLVFLLFQLVRIEIPFLVQLVAIIFTPLLISFLSFAFFLFYPLHRAAKRMRDIEVNLPFALTHMGAVAESGVPPYVIFRLISGFKEYGELAKELGKIVRNIEEFGMDPVSAVKEVAERTPSKSLQEVLNGFCSTTEAGGDVKLYLKTTGEQALFEWKIKREKYMHQLSAYAEFYTGIMIAAPLFLVALFSIMSFVQRQVMGFDILFLTRASTYLLIPLINLGFLLFLKGMEVEM